VEEVKILKQKNLTNIVVSGIFSPSNAEQEKIVGEIIKKEYPEAQITLSHELARLGLLERENAYIP
jgi:N-methylhydantoinase A/oxoprolinase/acetone carboxylase beta subunit